MKGGTTTTTTNNSNQSGSQYQNNAFNNYQSGSQGLDPRSQAFVNWQRNVAQQGANAVTGGGPLALGPNAGMLAALQGMQNAGSPIAGALGSAVNNFNLTMDPSRVSSELQHFMNPFLSGVVDPTRAEFDHLRGLASRDAKGAATQAGAFGGDRAALMEGARLGELDRAQASSIADLMARGHEGAMGALMQDRALRANAQGGLGAAITGLGNIDLQRQQMLFDNWNTLRGVEQGTLPGLEAIQKYGTALNFANMGMGPTGSMFNTTQGGTSNMTGGYSGMSSETSRTREQKPFDPFSMALGVGGMLSGLGWAPFAANAVGSIMGSGVGGSGGPRYG